MLLDGTRVHRVALGMVGRMTDAQVASELAVLGWTIQVETVARWRREAGLEPYGKRRRVPTAEELADWAHALGQCADEPHAVRLAARRINVQLTILRDVMRAEGVIDGKGRIDRPRILELVRAGRAGRESDDG